jgi:Ca-activated chloride channel family protein
VATFDERVSLVTGFLSDRHKLGNSLLDLRPGGMTALWDAVGFGLDHIRGARHRKKVLVVITDGEDNASRTALRQVFERAEADDALIYPVGMFEEAAYSRFGVISKDAGSTNARFGLEMLAKATGTAAHFPLNIDECKRAMTAIGQEVRRQYTVAFYPTNVARDGTWHAIRVVVRSGDPVAIYVVRTRSGYYATGGGHEP